MARDYEGFYEVKPSILERDKFTCQVCGIRGIDTVQEFEEKRIDFLSDIISHPEKYQEQLVTREIAQAFTVITLVRSAFILDGRRGLHLCLCICNALKTEHTFLRQDNKQTPTPL